MNQDTQKQIVILAGPTGSGKDTIADEIIKKCSNCVSLTTATTRKMRPGEIDGISYHFLSKEKFLEELENGNIPEHQYREGTDTYYGTYLPDLETKIANGSVVIGNVQIIGARYLKKHMNALTIFLHPKPKGILESRIRERDPSISDLEVNERLDIAITEIKVHAPWYDYTVDNIDGKLSNAVDDVLSILNKEDLQLIK